MAEAVIPITGMIVFGIYRVTAVTLALSRRELGYCIDVRIWSRRLRLSHCPEINNSGKLDGKNEDQSPGKKTSLPARICPRRKAPQIPGPQIILWHHP